jgi:hypothetical protein
MEMMSPAYREQQEHLHQGESYGVAGQMYGPLVSQIVNKLQITHLLDYGCGRKMSLLKTLKAQGPLKYQGYDPGAGLEELATAPIPAQMVCCIDVLEHIEPQYLDNVLNHLRDLTEVVTFLTIHTGPAMKVLPDGRNAHLTQEPMSWWLPKLWDRFDLQTVQQAHENGFYIIAYAKPRELEAKDGSKLSNLKLVS